MTELGPVSAALHSELREMARQRGIVVWLDKEGSYTGFVDRLLADEAAVGSVPLRAFRGSYLALMLGLENLEDGVTMTPLVIHVPGHTEDSIADTPLFELYRAGSRHRRALSTLVEEAAHGHATPAAIATFVGRPGLTLDEADAWLTRQQAGPATDVPDLGMHTATALYDDLIGRGPVSTQLDRPAVVRAVARRAEALLGLTEPDQRRILEQPEDLSGSREPSAAERADDLATALAGWALSVEFVHDLRREPADEWLRPLRHLSKAAVAACQQLAGHLRGHHPDRYRTIAAHTESLLPIEAATATAADLGKIDTFQFEDATVMAAALDALHGARFAVARDLATQRTGGKSFWTSSDPRRRIAWRLVELAAQLGFYATEHEGLLDGCHDLADAVGRYEAGGYLVDHTHRLLEQAREELPQLDLAEAATLRARLDQLRSVYRNWAEPTAEVFNRLCQRDGFLPGPSLQQRNLFDEVVAPLVAEDDGPVAYVMVDALRYEMGVQLAEALRERSAQVEVRARLAELPTITEVGMNVLAPVVRAGRLTVDVRDDKILGFRAGELRIDGPDDRRRAIHDRLGGDACPRLTLEELISRDATSVKRSLARARAIIVHAEGIDKAGEKGVGLAVFERELQHLRAAWRVLYEAGVKRFVFTADHGYLLHDDTTREPLRHGKQTDPQRRHVVSDHRRALATEVTVSAAELGYDGAELFLSFPLGIAPFDQGARAKDFVHGGNSLQERVIPVVTVRHRHAAGGDKATYEISAEARLPVQGLHCVQVTVRPTRQTNLVYGSQAEVELVLEGVDDDSVRLELCDVHHARRTGAGVLATVDQALQVYFRLSGDTETRVPVRVRSATRAVEVQAAVTSERFQVLLRDRPAVAASAREVSAPPAASTSWLEALPDGVRAVFRHLAEHGTISEAEATTLLGGVRQFRTFSRSIDTYRRQVPFAVRIEMASGSKCYVRGEPEST